MAVARLVTRLALKVWNGSRKAAASKESSSSKAARAARARRRSWAGAEADVGWSAITKPRLRKKQTSVDDSSWNSTLFSVLEKDSCMAEWAKYGETVNLKAAGARILQF
jgi:hypothetical protein